MMLYYTVSDIMEIEILTEEISKRKRDLEVFLDCVKGGYY